MARHAANRTGACRVAIDGADVAGERANRRAAVSADTLDALEPARGDLLGAGSHQAALAAARRSRRLARPRKRSAQVSQPSVTSAYDPPQPEQATRRPFSGAPTATRRESAASKSRGGQTTSASTSSGSTS